jgi:hypothetical protein
MPSFVQNPRRAPRVRVRLPVELAWGSAAWRGTMVDVSATGCAVHVERQVPAGTRLSIAVLKGATVAPLAVEAQVVWCRGMRLAATFTRAYGGVDLNRWMEALQQADSGLRGAADRLPPQIPTDARLTVRRDAPMAGPLGPDETRILQAAWGGCPVGIAVLHARLPPERFARALYALLGKGIVTSPALESGLVRGDGSLDDLARALLGREPPGAAPSPGSGREPSERGSLRQDRIAADLAFGSKPR